MTEQLERVVAGRYALLREIGRGGMGVVWLSEDRTIGRRVAIKELHLPDGVAPAEREVFEERVLREARAAGRLNDPGVVTVYDVVRDQDTTFIVMELIEATTLTDLVRDRGPLPQEVVARLAEQLLSALRAAHAAGVVHRDVKPSNIMVQANGRVKLTDFGIAQSTDDPRLTTSGVLVGSPVYMAPERLRGQDADAGSDLWSLGAVLFFAVEGYAAFERASTAATMHAILNEVPFLTRCQGPLASVIMGLLNAHPEARPRADQVAGLLSQVTMTPANGFAAQTAHLASHATAHHAPPAAPRRRWGAVTAVVLVLAAGLFAAGFGTRVATEPAPGDDRPANMASALTYGEGGYFPELSWDRYPEGGCMTSDLTEGRRITQSAHVECDQPHVFEVFQSRTFYSPPADHETWPDIDYPGHDGLVQYTEAVCRMIFESAAMLPETTTSGLRYRAVVPTEDTWREHRASHCVLYSADNHQLDKSYRVVE
ncbi:serine/threonine-protein kinase [Actinophytocola glycyrrhizae]|uniref:non-specific serine/threonine protein kinase n=1 Tax=Actinophytocola glycyrrhizae TaxID=2044873 RepID=A0ABV9S758_9PSEU